MAKGSAKQKENDSRRRVGASEKKNMRMDTNREEYNRLPS